MPNSSRKSKVAALLILAAMFFSLLFLFIGEDNGGVDVGKPSGEAADARIASVQPGAPEAVRPSLVSPEGLVFEESLFPTLTDYLTQADYAIDETMRRLGLSASDLLTERDELRDERGVYYRYRSLRVYAGKNVPLFVNTLRDCLLAWAAEARLVRELPLEEAGNLPEEAAAVWNIVLEGVVTHSLSVYAQEAPPARTDRLPPGETPVGGAPKMVIVLDDLGESQQQAQLLLRLDFPVTFAVWPQSTHARAVALAAAGGGREVIIHQPMEPLGYPEVKPGAGALLNSMSDQEILARLRDNLSRVPQATGLNNHMGSRLTQNGRIMGLVAGELKKRDLLALDSLTHPRSQFGRTTGQAGVSTYRRDIFLDVQPDKQSVLEQLKKAEQIALLRGQSIAIGHPLPGTLAALGEWQEQRNRKVQLVRLRDLVPLEK